MTISTRIIGYSFDVSKPGQAEAYDALCDQLRATPGRGKILNPLVEAGRNNELHIPEGGAKVELSERHIYKNQWDADFIEGFDKPFRVFDWYEVIYPNRDLKRGHYLEITDEMRSARDHTKECGFCGHQEPVSTGNEFCPRCPASRYLDTPQHPLLVLLPVSTDRGMTTFSVEIMSRLEGYIETKRNAAFDAAYRDSREKVDDDAERDILRITMRRNGYWWLLDHRVPLNDWHFHQDSETFSYRPSPNIHVNDGKDAAENMARFLKANGFPYKYKCQYGRGFPHPAFTHETDFMGE